ncbi:unnamed protein product [Gordionus sp. m RMFG-2023]
MNNLTLINNYQNKLLDQKPLSKKLYARSSNMKFNMPNIKNAKSICPENDIQMFKMVALINQGGLCESVIFGDSFTIFPTYNWKLDWNELENNRKAFAALCQYLRRKNNAMVVEYECDSNRQCKGQDLLKHGLKLFFIVLPSYNNTLLMKQALSEEIYMPKIGDDMLLYDMFEDESFHEYYNHIEDICNKLPRKEFYNPLEYRSNLDEHLPQPLIMNDSDNFNKFTGKKY